jgi:hypothetical protein
LGTGLDRAERREELDALGKIDRGPCVSGLDGRRILRRLRQRDEFMSVGHKLIAKDKRIFQYDDSIKVREPNVSLEAALKLTRVTILKIEFLLAIGME